MPNKYDGDDRERDGRRRSPAALQAADAPDERRREYDPAFEPEQDERQAQDARFDAIDQRYRNRQRCDGNAGQQHRNETIAP